MYNIMGGNMKSCRTVADLNDPELKVYQGLHEAQLKHYYEPHGGLFICESPKVIRRALRAGYEPVSLLLEDAMMKKDHQDILAKCEGLSVYSASKEVLIQLTGYHLTGGMLCAMKRKELPPAKELCKTAHRIAVLMDIENPTNIGAIFRNAAAFGLDALLLTAGCSDPLYRRAARVSVGTVFQIPWTFLPEKEDALRMLKDLGFCTAALALSPSAESIASSLAKEEERLAILLGNEEHGLDSAVIQNSDYQVIIPMAQGVDSLNVAAASAIAFWELRENK